VPELRPLDVRGVALSILPAALWGANPVAIKLGLADMPPLRLALMRFVLSAVVIFAFAMLTGRYDVLVLRHADRALRRARHSPG
jgi:drug/metabolite transporter (DMT)-like permease